ncbi:hypothetical protein GCM10007103_20910 [Salinimicrobium marinum]|uniref:BT4734-like N-terminal domain-containing protein n=1 Tax=Salinimicrobium marinum TaxID=680283 RepID=A0A918SH90_9FLAO|nr:BT4734/BF3469 family protein [Salinimicrobium marinum]GHA39404.1 hypothetical protein GCM10007103_20910 [Salinimicrobium marinum]
MESNQLYNPTVSIFKCCKSPFVIEEVSVTEILHNIKTGGKDRDLKIKARTAALKAQQEGKNNSFYVKVKTNDLNTFTPNATFTHKRNLGSIKKLSGLVYLDIDGCTDIDLNNPYIFATWLSLSGTGRGVLVKAEGLSRGNFSIVYESLAKELGLEVDHITKDISRQVVISYDPDIYINSNSITYICKKEVDNKIVNTPLTVPKKRKKKICDLKGDKKYNNIRYDNLEDYNLEGKDYVVFEEEVRFSKLFIPEVITSNRYIKISTTVHQLMALNPHLGLDGYSGDADPPFRPY